MRAATAKSQAFAREQIFQSTQPMRAATTFKKTINVLIKLFQSTQPMRAATMVEALQKKLKVISIHAAHAGCDG